MGKIRGEETWISLGPWGGNGGTDWAYKVDGPIMQMTVHYVSIFIRSIVFESNSGDGVTIGSSEKIDGTGDCAVETFCIDNSVEQLSSISLTYKDYLGQPIITSLCIETNIGNKYGPFGSNWGSSASIPVKDGVLAGFHGRTEDGLITAIGIFVAPKVNSLRPIQDQDFAPIQRKGKIIGEEGWISLGPWGGGGGAYSTYKSNGPIMQITIRCGDVIDSILFESKRRDGVVIGSSVKIGGSGGANGAKFCIDSSVEHLSSIRLTYGDYCGYMVIKEICFFTNLKTYGPYGMPSGDSSLYIPIKWGVIVGFHGRGGIFLDAIGIFVAPKVNKISSSEKDLDYVPTQLEDKIIGEEGWISLGPWGGGHGVYSTYKPNEPIMQITIRYGTFIDSILFESKSRDGVVIGSSVKIGGPGGANSAKFCIDSSVEQLSSVSLTYTDYRGYVILNSLFFNTNIKKYGPFGSGGDHSLSIPIEGGVIAGFHGRGERYVEAIGIFVTPKVKGKIRSEEGWISFGPWGGNDGVDWTYKANGPIMQISICYGEAINSLLFRSRSCDGLVIGSSEEFGTTGSRTTKTV